MKTESQIRDKLFNYEKNFPLIKNELGKSKVNYAIEELKWCLKDKNEK